MVAAVGTTSGVLVALSLPPFGLWVLAPVGFAGLAVVLAQPAVGLRARRRALAGGAFGLGQYTIGLWWVTEFHWAGYVALVLLGLAYAALIGVLVRTTSPWARVATLASAVVLAEGLRGAVPFGGLPLGGTALGQAAGPLAAGARLGGSIFVSGLAALAGAGLAELAVGAAHAGSRRAVLRYLGGPVALVLVAGSVVAGRMAPDGGGPGPHASVKVATVQGGGRRGLRSIYVDPGVVFERQVAVTRTLSPGLDLVLWPEDVLAVDGPVATTPQAMQVAGLARQLQAALVVGVVEDDGPDHFRNAAVVWSAEGAIVARYDKVHRVPFGEYVPARSFFRHLADLSVIPRDEVAGRGPGLVMTPVGPMGTVISYEVFFDSRARAAIRAGGEVLLVPTNASSFRTSQVPTQEVAAAQLRAWETGRDTVQAAPTGYSAIIDHRGRILARSVLGRPQTLVGTVERRSGRTLYVRYGPAPALVLALALLAACWAVALHPDRRHPPAAP
jgi:apolipoprotein N-acyltransferase